MRLMLPLPLPIKRRPARSFSELRGLYALLPPAAYPEAEKQVWYLQEMLSSIGEAFPILTSVYERMQLQTFVQATVMYEMTIATHEQRIVPLVATTAHFLQ